MRRKLAVKLILVSILVTLGGTLFLVGQAKGFIIPIPPGPSTDLVYNGYVKDTDGNAIKGAVVKLYSGNSYKGQDSTSSSGYYSITIQQISNANLKASKKGYVTQTKSVGDKGGKNNFNLKGFWALIVGGETESRFTLDAVNMYNTLIDHYSFTESRIYLLTTDATIDQSTLDGNTNTEGNFLTNGNGNEDFDYPVPRDRATSRANVEWATNQLENKVCSGDQVVVWWTGHGGDHIFATDDDTITADQFDSYLDDITCEEMFFFLGPCHSGSFNDTLGDEQNRAIYTSCKSYQSGWGNGVHSYYPWATHLGLDSDYDAADADDDDDNRVSLAELYDYCVDFIDSHTNQDQDPQDFIGSQIDVDTAYIGDGYY
jgi:hypothetical protein